MLSWMLHNTSTITVSYLILVLVFALLLALILWLCLLCVRRDRRALASCCAYVQVFLLLYVMLLFFLVIAAIVWHEENPMTIQGESTIDGKMRSSFRGPMSISNSSTRVHNWGQTLQFSAAEICRPSTVQEVQSVVLGAKKAIGVIGAGHSYSPLVERVNGTIISLERMDRVLWLDETKKCVWVEAGIDISTLNQKLYARGYCLHGFGSIQAQSVAGGFSTSLHGPLYQTFASQVLSVRAVLANGTLVEVLSDSELLPAFRASLGVLGVIVHVELRVHSLVNLLEKNQLLPLEEWLRSDPSAYFKNATAFNLVSSLARGSDAVLTTYHETPEPSVLQDFEEFPAWQVNGFDYVLMPLLCAFPSIARTFDVSSLVDSTSGLDDGPSRPLPFSWQHFPQYGMLYAEYCIPMENCTRALRTLQEHAASAEHLYGHYAASVQVRLLRASDEAYLGFSDGLDSCSVEVYSHMSQVTNERFHREWEAHMHALGGRSHWGTVYFGSLRHQRDHFRNFSRFAAIRKTLDPHGIFLNDYLHSLFAEDDIHPEQDNHSQRYHSLTTWDRRRDAFEVVVWILILLPPILLCLLLVQL